MHDPKQIAERIRSLLLLGFFDLRCFGEYLTKVGDGGYIITDAIARDGNVDVQCLGRNTFTIFAPEDVTVTDEIIAVNAAPRVVHRRYGVNGECSGPC
jgi:hypothetical protein